MVTQGSTQDGVAPVQPIVQKRFIGKKMKGFRLCARHSQCVVPVGHKAQVPKIPNLLPERTSHEKVGSGDREVAPEQDIDGGILGACLASVPAMQNTFVHSVPPVLCRQGTTVRVNEADPRDNEGVTSCCLGDIHQALQAVRRIAVV